ncbi:hypothetical protein MAP00_004291 [Monascus purpureus]|nr:hypothetical protein MAP00_004291 [Monascus purpureus]
MDNGNATLHIVSLGSSFAAGPGIRPVTGPRGAGRSGANYAHILAQSLNVKLTDLSVSGATLLNIISEPQSVPFISRTFPPQITHVPEDSDIVTITAGGNDVGYVGGMMLDAWNATIPGRIIGSIIQVLQTCLSVLRWRRKKERPTSTSLTTEELATRMGEVLDAIHRKAPKARILLVEYLALLSPGTTRPGRDIPFGQDKINYHVQRASELQRAYVLATQTRGNWCQRVPIHELSEKHALGSRTPWVTGFGIGLLLRGIVPLHPNAEGMKEVAGILLQIIQSWK